MSRESVHAQSSIDQKLYEQFRVAARVPPQDMWGCFVAEPAGSRGKEVQLLVKQVFGQVYRNRLKMSSDDYYRDDLWPDRRGTLWSRFNPIGVAGMVDDVI